MLCTQITKSPNHQILIKVSDTGQGIPPEKLPLRIRPFLSGRRFDHPAGRGYRIGLTLTKELVHLLGGQINVDSRPGEGATFIVTLPVGNRAETDLFR